MSDQTENKGDGNGVQEELALEEKETAEETPKESQEEILKDIRDHLSKPAAVTPAATAAELTPQQRRDILKEQTGMTDAQLDFHEKSVAAAVVSQTAPLRERAAWSDLKDKVGAIEPDIAEEMKKELSQYSPQMKGDPILVEKVYYMTVGRFGHKKGGSPVAKEPAKDESVIQRRVVSSTPGSSQGLSGGGGGGSKAKVSDDERKLFSKFGIKSDEEWANYRDNQVIGSFKK